MWPKIKKRFLKRPSNHKASVQVENPQYYIVEQGKFTVELGVTIKCPYVPMQLASLPLLIAGKAHDFIKILPLFKDEITTKAISYRMWYKMIYEEFYLGKAKKPNGADSIAIGIGEGFTIGKNVGRCCHCGMINCPYRLD